MSSLGIRLAALAAGIILAAFAVWVFRADGLTSGPMRGALAVLGFAKDAPAGAGPGAAGPGGAMGGIPVETAKAKALKLAETVRAVGTFRSDESVIMRPEIAGRVIETPFTEGQVVDQGALLFRLDDSIVKAELVEAEAAYVLARQNNQRARELLEKGAGTARARDEALARMDMDRARVELARARLAKTRIQAPFAGIVGLRQVSVGDFVAAGQDLINIESIDAVKLDFRIPERHLAQLAVGQTVSAEVDAFPGRSFEGRVYAIDPQIDPAGHSIAVRARLPNPERRLRPGLFARVALAVSESGESISIPEQAILPRGEKFFIYKVVDGKAALTPVEIGRRVAGQVQVVRGLAPGEEVVTAGQMKLQDGAPVQPIGPPAAGNSAGAPKAGS